MIWSVSHARWSPLGVIAFWFIGLMLISVSHAVSAAEPANDGRAPCQHLQSAIENAHLKQRPDLAGDISGWVKPESEAMQKPLKIGERVVVDSGMILTWLRARGTVGKELEAQLDQYTDDYKEWTIRQILPPVSGDVTVVYVTVGTSHCLRSRMFALNQDKRWVMQPEMNLPEDTYCEVSISLADIDGKNVIVHTEAHEQFTDFKLSAIDAEHARKPDDGEMMCGVRAKFERQYFAIVDDETENRGTCHSSICKFLTVHADEIGEGMRVGKPPAFVLVPEMITDFPVSLLSELNWAFDFSKFEKDDPRLPHRWNLGDVWPENPDWLIWQPFEAGWYSVSKRDHDVRKLEWPKAKYDPTYGFNETNAFAAYSEWPFVLDGKLYVLKVGEGSFGWRTYPGFIYEVAEFDGMQFRAVGQGVFKESGGGDPKFSYWPDYVKRDLPR